MSFGTILTMAGGLGLFLFGMELMSDSIEKVAGARLRRILEIFTTNRFMGMIVGQLSRTDQKAFQHSGTGAKTMHTLSPVQLRHPAFEDLFPVLARAQLLLCFGFFVAEVG